MSTAIDTASILASLLKSNTIHKNLRSSVLVEHAVRRGEGLLADNGALWRIPANIPVANLKTSSR